MHNSLLKRCATDAFWEKRQILKIRYSFYQSRCLLISCAYGVSRKFRYFRGTYRKWHFFASVFGVQNAAPKSEGTLCTFTLLGRFFGAENGRIFCPALCSALAFLEPRFFSPRGCPTQLCSSMADNVWISTRAKSCPLPRKGSVGGVQNRRAVIAAVALDRPPPPRGAVRLRRGGMRAARGAAPKTPR